MPLMTVKEVSQWLQVKASTIYLWVADGHIPALKIHGVIRFRRDELEVWLETCRTETLVPSPPSVRRPRSRDRMMIDAMIETAKREGYTPLHGKPDQGRATRKGDTHGTV